MRSYNCNLTIFVDYPPPMCLQGMITKFLPSLWSFLRNSFANVNTSKKALPARHKRPPFQTILKEHCRTRKTVHTLHRMVHNLNCVLNTVTKYYNRYWTVCLQEIQEEHSKFYGSKGPIRIFKETLSFEFLIRNLKRRQSCVTYQFYFSTVKTNLEELRTLISNSKECRTSNGTNKSGITSS